jgi:hypothetical protein
MAAIDHGRALSYVFAREDWPKTLLFVTLATLVPLVGPIVVQGYQAVIAEHVAGRDVARREDGDWPPFDFDRLADYLMRGLRVFVVSLVAGVLVVPVAMGVVWLATLVSILIGTTARGGGEDALVTFLSCALTAAGGLVFAALIFGVLVLILPLWLQAGINPDLAGAFDIGFLRDFLGRTAREVLLAHLALVCIHFALLLAGALACIVGVFPAIGLMMLVQAHLYGQLYGLYLSRGGRPIPTVRAGQAV